MMRIFTRVSHFDILPSMKKTILLSLIISVLLSALPASAELLIYPTRVIDARTHTVIDFEGLIARCADADIVTLGENHDDPGTHMAEFALLEGLWRYRGDNVVFSMEMFERDVQHFLDGYLIGDLDEDNFLLQSRPWGNYDTDYRMSVEFAREHGLPVIAANIPRPMASVVASVGYENTDFTDEEIPWMASTFEDPRDAYFDAFVEAMQMPGMADMGVTDEMIFMVYQAQVVKDETMAESVTMAYENNPGSVVYHINGSFHTRDYLGTFSRIRRNLPAVDCVSIIAVPVDDLLAGVPEDTPKADYYILTLAPEEEETMEMPEMPPMPPEDGS